MSNFVILHKKEKNLNLNVLYNESDQTNICNIHEKECASCNTIHHSSFIYKKLKKFNLCNFYSNRAINHLMTILISIFISGYHGKTMDFAKSSSCYNNTIAHFLNSGKWDDVVTFKYLKTFCHCGYLLRSSTHRKTCFLYRGRYDCFIDKAFVTGSASY